jgi:hypothetical protein
MSLPILSLFALRSVLDEADDNRKQNLLQDRVVAVKGMICQQRIATGENRSVYHECPSMRPARAKTFVGIITRC